MPDKVSIQGVWKSFSTDQGSLSVLEDIAFGIAEGEFVALVGPSGCGKSTLLNILTGFERPDRGELRIGELQFLNEGTRSAFWDRGYRRPG